MTPLIVAWAPVIQRYDGLGPLLDADVVNFRDSGPAPWRYLVSSVRTWRTLQRRRPTGVLVALPPLPLLAVCWAWCRLRRRPLVVDLHSAVFESPKWRWAQPGTLWLAARSTLTLVHHDGYLDRVPNARVLHEVFEPDSRPRWDGGFVLWGASWHEDEPIAEVLEAARLLPEVQFKITGKPKEGGPLGGGRSPRSRGSDDEATPLLRAPRRGGHLPDRLRPQVDDSVPPNVTLTGYVSDDEYLDLLATCTLVLALTTRENTMQAGGYQAMAWHKPLVTSDTPTLRQFFRDAATYTQPTPPAIMYAVCHALENHAEQAKKMAALHERMMAGYAAQLAPVREALS